MSYNWSRYKIIKQRCNTILRHFVDIIFRHIDILSLIILNYDLPIHEKKIFFGSMSNSVKFSLGGIYLLPFPLGYSNAFYLHLLHCA